MAGADECQQEMVLVRVGETLARVDQVLCLGESAGETVFDRLLIELVDVPVIYKVKGGSILNDA